MAYIQLVIPNIRDALFTCTNCGRGTVKETYPKDTNLTFKCGFCRKGILRFSRFWQG